MALRWRRQGNSVVHWEVRPSVAFGRDRARLCAAWTTELDLACAARKVRPRRAINGGSASVERAAALWLKQSPTGASRWLT